MVKSSLGLGGPQPAEVRRMLDAQRKNLDTDRVALTDRRTRLATASKTLDAAFAQMRTGR